MDLFEIEKSEIEKMGYEEAFAALEQVIASLESGEQSLERSLALYERGKAFAERCSKLLDQAELRVKQLSGDKITNFVVED